MSPEEQGDQLMFARMHELDPAHEGCFVEIGCGTSNFSFVRAIAQGWRSIAAEPMMSAQLQKAISEVSVAHDRCAIADHDGTVDLYLHPAEDVNFASLSRDWVDSRSSIAVKAKTLATFLADHSITRIGGLKLDVEGAEVMILRQLRLEILPSVVQWEYGGGNSRASGKAGWSKQGIANSWECFSILEKFGFNQFTLFDWPSGKVLQCIPRLFLLTVPADSHYGNIVAWRHSAAQALGVR